LAYRWGALPELIDDGVNGFAFEHGDIPAMAEQLRQLCREPQKIIAMGEAARERAVQYDLQRLRQQLGQAYSLMLRYSIAATISQ
jgi:glycosyltransferase involved in cell wall biosynthesis